MRSSLFCLIAFTYCELSLSVYLLQRMVGRCPSQAPKSSSGFGWLRTQSGHNFRKIPAPVLLHSPFPPGKTGCHSPLLHRDRRSPRRCRSRSAAFSWLGLDHPTFRMSRMVYRVAEDAIVVRYVSILGHRCAAEYQLFATTVQKLDLHRLSSIGESLFRQVCGEPPSCVVNSDFTPAIRSFLDISPRGYWLFSYYCFS
jgi:hypothetical protein